MKKILLLLAWLLIAEAALAQNTSRYFGGDYKFTEDEFTINANTADGADDGRMNLTGGGGTGTSVNRGGYISLYGADRGGAGLGGDVTIYTADDGDILLQTKGSGDINLYASGASGYINFKTNGQSKWYVDPSPATTSELYFGMTGTPNWTGNILAASFDGSDNGRLTLSGGGAVGTTRGGRIDLYGADRGGAGAGGDVTIYTADAGDILLQSQSSGDVRVNSSGTGFIFFEDGGEQKWFISPAAASVSELYYGISGSANWVGRILAITSDGNDNSILSLTGGGAAANTRGGYINLFGADSGGAGAGGDIDIVTADNGNLDLDTSGSGDINIRTGASGYIDFVTNGEQKWFISPTIASVSQLDYGILGSSNWHGRIYASSADGNDDYRLSLSGGGDASVTRGGHIELYGADRGGPGAGGDVFIHAADGGEIQLASYSTGDIELITLNTGYIDFSTGSEQKWYIPPSPASVSHLDYGILGSAGWHGRIYAATADGADSSRLSLSGGGDALETRGGHIDLYGSDRGGPGAGGDVDVDAGDNGNVYIKVLGTGDIKLSTGASGYIDFITDSLQRWFVPPTAAGTAELYYGTGNVTYDAKILAATADANDTSRITIGGGGAAATTRGGRIELRGSDYGGAGAGGQVTITGGDNGDITLVTGGTGNVQITDTGAGGAWRNFGAVSTVTACTVTNGDYVTITLGGVAKRIVLCD